MNIQHKELADGRWFTLSFAEQMGNIGSEISRAAAAKEDQKRWSAITRAFELLDLTLQDDRWRGRRKEITRVREVLGDAVLGGKDYGTTLTDLDHYFFPFAFAARTGR